MLLLFKMIKMSSHKLWILIFYFLFNACQDNKPVISSEQKEQIDSIFADWQGNRPGGAVGIIQNGDLIYEKYFGMANLEKGEAFSIKTITDIGSISKQFTAFCIALLEEKGQLHIEDDIREYLPEMPKYEQPIQIKHLLFHTSGIKDQEELMLLKGLEPYGGYMTNDFALQLIFKQSTTNFSPATKYEYSNANYVLLTEIVKRVSGQSLTEFAKQEIFEPLGMTNTFFNLNQGKDFDLKAIGYKPQGDGFEKEFYETHVIGDGGIYTTLADMVKWDANFYNNKLGKGLPSLIDRMKYREKMVNGQMNNMAFAQFNTMHYFGKESWSHGGGGGGYRSFYERFEEVPFSVIVLSNSDNSDSFNKSFQVVKLFLDNSEASNPPSIKTITQQQVEVLPVSQNKAKLLSGYYFSKDRLIVLEIESDLENNQFIIKWLDGDDTGYAAMLVNETTIAEKEDTDYRYQLDLDRQQLIHAIKGRVDLVFDKILPFKDNLPTYQGNYYSKDLDYAIQFSITGNQMTATSNYFTALKPIGQDLFMDAISKSILAFQKNDKNQIIGFHADIPRGDRSLRKMIFQKIDK